MLLKDKERERDHDLREKEHDYDQYIPSYDREQRKEGSFIDPKNYKKKDVVSRILMVVEGNDKMLKKTKRDFYQLNQTITLNVCFIK